MRSPLLFSVVCGVLGYALNSVGLSVFGDAEIIFGGAVTLVVAFWLGPWWGVLASLMAFGPTWEKWGHPWGLACFGLEAVVVGILVQRRGWQPLRASLLYWCALGAPLALLGRVGLSDASFPGNWATAIVIPVNGLVMLLAAIPACHSPRLRRLAGLGVMGNEGTPLNIVLFRRFGVILAFTLLVFLLLAGRTFERTLNGFAREKILLDGRQVAHQLQAQLDRHQNLLVLLANELAAAPADHPALTARLDRLLRAHPGLLTLLAADAGGQIVAAAPATGRDGAALADGGHSVANREYFTRPMATRQAYFGPAETGRLYQDELILPISVPVPGSDGRPVLVVKASLNLAQLLDLVEPADLIKGRSVVITDQNGRLITRTGYIPREGWRSDLPMFGAARQAGGADLYRYDDVHLGRLEQFIGTRQTVPGYGWRVYYAEPVWQITSLVAWFYFITLTGAVAALGLALLFARATAVEITTPFARLVAAIQNFKHTEPALARPEIPHASRELATISRELHSAALTLSRSNRDLAEAIADRDITHQKLRLLLLNLEDKVRERTEELDEARHAAESASQAKSEFLASMSHELRTPLNVILGMSELMLEEGMGPLTGRQTEGLQHINESGRHLLELINDILDLSKIEAGMLDLQIQATAVSDVCAASIRFVQEAARKKGIMLRTDLRQNSQDVPADDRRLKQILINLLVNAVKFTPPGGQVGLDVTESTDGESIRFDVWDTGIGIAKEHFEHIFQPFRQIDSSMARQYAGTGLGLALVKRMTRLHGGKVELASSPGKGSRFRIILPLRSPAAAPAPDETAVADDESLPPLAPAGLTRILIAEDNDANKDVYRSYFHNKGFVLSMAANGAEAVDRAIEELPDLILMDLHMPVLDGLAAMRRLRADPRTEHIPMIAVTALAMPEDRLRCLEAGACAYLSKPINLRELGRLIASHARRPDQLAAVLAPAL